MAKKKEHRCSRRVYTDGTVFAADCVRKGKYHEGGLWWCWQHCPSKVKARREARHKKWRDEDARRDALDKKRRQRQAAEQKACEGISTAALEAGVVKGLVEACKGLLDVADAFAAGEEGWHDEVNAGRAALALAEETSEGSG